MCWYVNKDNRNGEVGYWLGDDFTGQGLTTKAARAAISYLFNERNLHRIEMQCGVENQASRSVAQRCGLKQEGIAASLTGSLTVLLTMWCTVFLRVSGINGAIAVTARDAEAF